MPRLPARWRWIWFAATLAIGAVGTIAVLSQRNDDDPIDSSTQTFDIDSQYEGPVWFTVDGATDRTLHVTVTWGGWQADLDIDPDDSHTWWMMKRTTGDSPPLSFEVSPAATVSVGLNSVPVKSEPVPNWLPRTTDAADT